jgi:hypothetical protein
MCGSFLLVAVVLALPDRAGFAVVAKNTSGSAFLVADPGHMHTGPVGRAGICHR